MPTQPAASAKGNLPAQLSRFIGRRNELEQVGELVKEHRLLTLTGPGGSGKTRLALKVAAGLLDSFPDGIWFVDLAPIVNGYEIVSVAAAVVGVRETEANQLESVLYERLRSSRALLLLDNCEHLLAAAGNFANALLTNCPGLQLLATSRQPLSVPGEALFLVPPLSLPVPQPWRAPIEESEALAALKQSEAVQLFVARAQAAAPAFELSAGNGPWVAEICRGLDGLPLALELVAAHARFFSVRQIAERLDDRFQLLTSPARAGPVRHQTLTATLDWSFSLLSPPEQLAFRRLSIFVDGWRLEAAEEVCAGGELVRQDVMGLLAGLVAKSLVLVEPSERYRLLEPIRHYSRQKLAESGELEAVADRHLEYFLEWTQMATSQLAGREQRLWLERFADDHGNLRAALDWAARSERHLAGLHLAANCGEYWRLRGYFSEGRSRLERALAAAPNDPSTPAHAWGWLWAANLAYLQGDYPATRPAAERGLAISQELGQAGRAGVARGLDLLGELATEVGDYQAAPAYFERALAIFKELEDERGRGDMLLQLGWTAMRSGDYSQAERRLDQSLPIFRELGAVSLLALALSGLGELAVRQGEHARAVELLEESLALRRELGERWGIATTLGSLGWVALEQRDFEGMKHLLAESMEIRLAIGDQGGLAWCLEKSAEALALQADSLPAGPRQQARLRAVRLYGAAEGLRAPLQSIIDPADQAQHQANLSDLEGSLGGDVFKQAWNHGRSMAREEAVRQALVPILTSEQVASLSGEAAAKLRFGGLSRRERETAQLIAQGMTNREIAEEMVVREKTIETYVTRILNKLGFDSRVQIATWALEVGLLEGEG